MYTRDLTICAAIVQYLGHYVLYSINNVLPSITDNDQFRSNLPADLFKGTMNGIHVDRGRSITFDYYVVNYPRSYSLFINVMSVNYSLIIEQKILQLLSLSSTAVSSILQPNGNQDQVDAKKKFLVSRFSYSTSINVVGCYTNPEVHTFSSKHLTRVSKLPSFGSYKDPENFKLLSAIHGPALSILKNFLTTSNSTVKLSPENQLIFTEFFSIFTCEVQRNLAAILTLPMCFELYNHFLSKKNDYGTFERYPQVRLPQELLMLTFQDYFPMSAPNAVSASIGLTRNMNQVISEIFIDEDKVNIAKKHEHLYTLCSETSEPDAWSGRTYIIILQSLIKDWLRYIHGVDFPDLDQFCGGEKIADDFLKYCKELLQEWYSIEITDDEDINNDDPQFQNLTDTFANLCGDMIYLSDEHHKV
ncbi:hypothetical protein [Orientia tsutsugamushi]|uniref:Uncharacterized protein n=1 Tax=Orientia tsutsugamushi TaxID=784 RepID=A0A2U3R032_ORITS|nr:hypothetical protein [Orientia tsutsugamushi]QES96717.1 hypothetical protein F0363_10115 [Orientia tsutsugamushi]SPR06522.1 Uncharacterised protein [Orientia tsutsugamushi]